MVIRMRHTRSHTRNRRSHHALSESSITICQNCKKPVVRHTVCLNCGQYRGRKVIDMEAVITKKEKKLKKAGKKEEAHKDHKEGK